MNLPRFASTCLLTSFATFSANAALVAYFPINSATDSSNFIDDIIDDPSHGVTDGTSSNNNGGIFNDPVRGDVLSTVQGHRMTAGTQDINLADGFTWSLWFRSTGDQGNNNEGGADVIIGSRNGIWNKVQPTSAQRFFNLSGYDVDDGDWHHMAFTGNSTVGGAMWIDGIRVATDATPHNNVQIVNDVFEIGGSSRFSEDAAGFIDDVAIWNEVISDQQIIDLASGAAVLIPEPGSIALLGFGGLALLRRRQR